MLTKTGEEVPDWLGEAGRGAVEEVGSCFVLDDLREMIRFEQYEMIHKKLIFYRV